MQRTIKSFVFTLIILAPVPAIALLGLYNFHVLISVLYSITAVLILLETLSGFNAFDDWEAYDTSDPIPCTAVIAAFLPNEAASIESTVEYFLSVPFDRVILAYNTPKAMPEVEARLKQLEASNPGLSIVKVEGSTSKAENLNYVIQGELITTPMVAIFDADHRPCPKAPAIASHWLNAGYDAVQGRCVIRDAQSWLDKVVAAEFDTVYRLLHNSRFNLTGTAIFGGSNGYWRAEVLKQFLFKKVLTEDIELSLRALAQGVQVAHDPHILSTEEAPPSIMALWKQRVRWSQGWLTVTLMHSRKVLMSRHLSWAARFYWAYNLIYREIFSFLGFSVVFVLAAYFFFDTGKDSAMFTATTIFTVASIVVCTGISAIACKLPNHTYYAWANLIGTFPFTLLKSIITTMAWTREITKDTKWETTARCKK